LLKYVQKKVNRRYKKNRPSKENKKRVDPFFGMENTNPATAVDVCAVYHKSNGTENIIHRIV
jgi:hypothetical protein